MPKQLNSRCQELVASLLKYFEQERDSNRPILPLTAVKERVAAAFNLNVSTVSAISQKVKNGVVLKSPKKRRSYTKRKKPECKYLVDDLAQQYGHKVLRQLL